MARLVPPGATAKLAAARSRRRRAPCTLALIAPVALAVLAIGGCGTSGDPPAHARAALHAANEHRLLALLERARTEVAAHSNVGVDATLSRFISDVNGLRASSELSTSTAATLDRQALATEVQASRQLQPGVSQSDATVLARDVQTATTASPPPKQPHPKPPATKGPGGGPPGQAEKGKPYKGWPGSPHHGKHGDNGGQGNWGGWVGSTGDSDS